MKDDRYLDFRNIKEYEKLIKPAEIIRGGGIVIFPTETVYGIGTNGLNEKAIEKLYEVKKRPKSKPISLLVSSIDMLEQVAENITDVEYELINKLFPGPFTIILNKKECVPNILAGTDNTIGVRIPDNEIAKKLINYAGVPIAAPSANISGMPSGINIKSIMKYFENNVDFFIDGGEAKLGISSTIVKVIDGVPNILRKGSNSFQITKQ